MATAAVRQIRSAARVAFENRAQGWVEQLRSDGVPPWQFLSIFSSVKDSQYDDLPFCHLVANLVLRGENASDFPGSEAREPLPEARLRRDTLDATENQTYGTGGCARIDGLQEVVQSTQVRVGRLGPAERHRISAAISVEG
jgi:hypothetical protein